jgi:hypothetical protein
MRPDDFAKKLVAAKCWMSRVLALTPVVEDKYYTATQCIPYGATLKV